MRKELSMNSDEDWKARNPYVIMRRSQYLHLNDPRCYDGCYFDAVLMWGGWEEFERYPTLDKANARMNFWIELNEYAVSQRGKSAKVKYKVKETR